MIGNDRKLKILMADDHQLILVGLKDYFESNYDYVDILTAINKEELFILLGKHDDIDALLLDVSFGVHNAKDFIPDLKTQYPNLNIVIISSNEDGKSIDFFLKEGVRGYVGKSESLLEIKQAIEKTISGEQYLSPIINHNHINYKSVKKNEHEVFLTNREKEVLANILNEKSTKEIADDLSVSEKTVEYHRSNLFMKFNVKNSNGLVKKAVLLGFLKD